MCARSLNYRFMLAGSEFTKADYILRYPQPDPLRKSAWTYECLAKKSWYENVGVSKTNQSRKILSARVVWWRNGDNSWKEIVIPICLKDITLGRMDYLKWKQMQGHLWIFHFMQRPSYAKLQMRCCSSFIKCCLCNVMYCFHT